MSDKIIAFAGNPNVGKSTVFNALTGLKQHTGNWCGKTVKNAQGTCFYRKKCFLLVDLPGTYSLMANSREEEEACNFIRSGIPDTIVVVADATCLERNLNLVLQILEITPYVVLCVNLLDEAKKKKITIDLDELSLQLGIPVVGTNARAKKGLQQLMDEIYHIAFHEKKTFPTKVPYTATREDEKKSPEEYQTLRVSALVHKAEEIWNQCVTLTNKNYSDHDKKIDQILTSKAIGIPVMLFFLCGLLWLTVVGANYPSTALSYFFAWIEQNLTSFFQWISVPDWIHGILVLGMYRTVAWVIAVMLPPMAIFFPLFTLLEEVGYLPRFAFNMDTCFKKSGSNGKQALTMCMGFGCNACGVIGCRIIHSPRERLIAILTNTFVPCNGRFPTIITLLSIFFIGMVSSPYSSILVALLLTGFLLLSVFITLLLSKVLAKTLLKGIPSAFTLELPPYRMPQIGKVLLRSLLDRTLFVLGRAIVVAIPAGVLLWLTANSSINQVSLLQYGANFLDPFAREIGLDGILLLAFLFGFPANEIVIPIAIMGYMATGSLANLGSLEDLRQLLVNNGWTWGTALCTILFSLFHFPCGTTCSTIYKETKSIKWTITAILLPTGIGVLLCFLVSTFLDFFR